MLRVAVSAGKTIRREGTSEACALDKVTVKPVFEFIKGKIWSKERASQGVKLRKAQWEKRLGCSENHKNLELARTKQTWSWDKAKTGTDGIRILEEIRVCCLSIISFKIMKCLPYAEYFCLAVIQAVNKAGVGAALLSLHLSKSHNIKKGMKQNMASALTAARSSDRGKDINV